MGAQAVEERSAAASTFSFRIPGESRLREQLDATRGELQLAQAQLDRANQIFSFSSRYRISADVAASVYDIALAEGIEPELAFRLVRVESEFNEKALSPVGAVGSATQPATARISRRSSSGPALRRETIFVWVRYLRTPHRVAGTETCGCWSTTAVPWPSSAPSRGLDPATGTRMSPRQETVVWIEWDLGL